MFLYCSNKLKTVAQIKFKIIVQIKLKTTVQIKFWKIIFLPSNLNIPCGLQIINLDNGRNLSEKKITTINNNNTFQLQQ
jgi:hypothetical protein